MSSPSSPSSQRASSGGAQNPGLHQAETPPATGTGTAVGRDAATSAAAGTGASGGLVPARRGEPARPQAVPAAGTADGGIRTAVRSLLARRTGATPGQPPEHGSPAIWERGDRGLQAPATHPTAPAPTGGGQTPPGRPARTVVLAAMCGAALLSVPFLVIGTGSHGGTHSSASTTPEDVANQAEPRALGSDPASASPSSSRPPSASPSPSGPAQHSPGPTAMPPNDGAAANALALTAAQSFSGADHVLLRNLGTGQCADLPLYGPGRVGGVIDQYDCQAGSSDNQMWTLKVVGSPKGPGGERLFTISNDKDNLCMDLPWYGAQPAGSAVSEYTCNATTADNQLWYLAPGDGDHYQLRNLASVGMCLSVAGGSSAQHGVRLVIEPCRSTAEDWALTSG
ncbi:RICIN domain-containing protein [Streptantibioticus ferralitis]|uniref:RICIN domain-containing protein n=1 Tax=Streptantibioticus ferralitis TaxID=236510 RepID=A0ABT5Z4S5_9ACTN|nr:RICIN domain-containing protein [Streptantibioticus ferralitis]MDF2258783.1 RICIN domain-containing protein [Streptantibioticus ferralitis]